MPELDSIIAVILAGLALSATPGPSMLYVLSRTVGQDRAAGFASALGLAIGGMIMAVATALGLAAIFAKFGWLVPALRYVGSAYLVWLGLGMIRSARENARAVAEIDQVYRKSYAAIVWQGVLVEVLNPKTVLFFALFLPPFVALDDGHLFGGSANWQLLTLGVLVPLTAIPSDFLVAYMGGRMAELVSRQDGFRRYLSWTGGSILILIAVNLLFGYL